MQETNVTINGRTPQIITASLEELKAVLQLAERAPKTTAEALYIEYLFERWYTEIQKANSPETGQPADRMA